MRNKKTTCTATVIHRGDSFTTNNKPHTHESKPGILTNVLIAKKIIETAKADIFTSAPTVVEKILEEDANPKKNPEYSRPNYNNIVWTANRHRQTDRPTEPQDMDFEIFLA